MVKSISYVRLAIHRFTQQEIDSYGQECEVRGWEEQGSPEFLYHSVPLPSIFVSNYEVRSNQYHDHYTHLYGITNQYFFPVEVDVVSTGTGYWLPGNQC